MLVRAFQKYLHIPYFASAWSPHLIGDQRLPKNICQFHTPPDLIGDRKLPNNICTFYMPRWPGLLIWASKQPLHIPYVISTSCVLPICVWKSVCSTPTKRVCVYACEEHQTKLTSTYIYKKQEDLIKYLNKISMLFVLVFVIFFLDHAAALVPHVVHILMTKKMDAKFICFMFDITTGVLHRAINMWDWC